MSVKSAISKIADFKSELHPLCMLSSVPASTGDPIAISRGIRSGFGVILRVVKPGSFTAADRFELIPSLIDAPVSGAPAPKSLDKLNLE